LCEPIAAYGQTIIHYASPRSIGHDFLEIENVNRVFDRKLASIEQEINSLLNKYKVALIDKDFANKELPTVIANNMENLNEGKRYLNGIFQWTD
jgi:hypothetical protein